VRPLLEELDADAGMADMFEDFEEGVFPQGMEKKGCSLKEWTPGDGTTS
jgi:hypothetical protein